MKNQDPLQQQLQRVTHQPIIRIFFLTCLLFSLSAVSVLSRSSPLSTAAFLSSSFSSTTRSLTLSRSCGIRKPTTRTTTCASPVRWRLQQRQRLHLSSKSNNQDEDDEDDDNKEETKKENPYADPNYPDLEFIDYSDPNYEVDMGLMDLDDNNEEEEDLAGVSSLTDQDDLQRLDEMRQERRRRNDEFQFQTYFAKLLQQGQEYQGEWTVYKCLFPPTAAAADDDNAMDKNVNDNASPPRLVRAASTYTVASRAFKINAENDLNNPLGERIVHSEQLLPVLRRQDKDDNNNKNNDDDDSTLLSMPEMGDELRHMLNQTYWPNEALCPADFRGPQGIMCVQNAYTLAVGVPLAAAAAANANVQPMTTTTTTSTYQTQGPFAEFRTEVGLTQVDMRFRIKLDYGLDESLLSSFSSSNSTITTGPPPPLFLRSLIVCRELLQPAWQRRQELQQQQPKDADDAYNNDDEESQQMRLAQEEALFGVPGADNGLYDPPPVDNPEQYLQVDLDGHATALFPYRMEQQEEEEQQQQPTTTTTNDDKSSKTQRWVVSLDWTPGTMRYQVDSKMYGGRNLLGLRTLELSQVLATQAETYRPRDGGANMRQ